MKRWRLMLFVLLVAFQVAVVATMAVSSQWVLTGGDRVVLDTMPVDPRDMFRGDYMVLRYAIGVINREEVPWYAADPYPGQAIWVVLEMRGDYDAAVAVEPEPVPRPQVAIRGEVMSVNEPIVEVTYGIEEYFVPEGAGSQIRSSDRVDVVAAVSEDGHAVIDYLVVNGEVWNPSRR